MCASLHLVILLFFLLPFSLGLSVSPSLPLLLSLSLSHSLHKGAGGHLGLLLGALPRAMERVLQPPSPGTQLEKQSRTGLDSEKHTPVRGVFSGQYTAGQKRRPLSQSRCVPLLPSLNVQVPE